MTWVNDYHARVRHEVRSHVDEATKAWLDGATAPDAAVEGADRTTLRLGGAASVKRIRFVEGARAQWFADSAQGLDAIREFVELRELCRLRI